MFEVLKTAKDYIILDYDISGEYQLADIIIYQSTKGNLISKTKLFNTQDAIVLDIAGLTSGVFLASLQIDGKIIETVKFSIVQ